MFAIYNYHLRGNVNYGKILPGIKSSTQFPEYCMSKSLQITLPLVLILSALTLSACATKKEPTPVAPPAQIETVAETPSAPVAAPEPSPSPVAAPEPSPSPVAAPEPTPKQESPKVKKKVAKHTKPKATPPAPVAAPVAAPAPVVPIVIPPPPPEPIKPAAIEPPPAQKVAEPGFLEKYWLWLLGLILIIVGFVVWQRKSQGNKS
jgi:hypothetical protein